jgi:hypothetical protein
MTEYHEIAPLSISDALDGQSGLMIPERVLQDLLKYGFNNVHSDQTLIDDLFHKYDPDTITAIKDYYANHTISIRQNFPRDDIKFPMVTILNASDSEDQSIDLIGDFLTSDLDVTRTQATRTIGHGLRTEIQVFCLAGKDSNAVLWLYYVTKAILTANINTLNAHGLHNIIFSGRDITLREDLFPEITYARVLSISCQNYFSVKLTERVAKSLVFNVFTENQDSGTLNSLEDY